MFDIKKYKIRSRFYFDVYRLDELIFSVDIEDEVFSNAKRAGIDFSNDNLLIKMALSR
ncbi:MAG: hypothetical protein JJ858_17435 [Rhizobiaceae bacterium]|nr:hypothetical protein [Rhizobiaceae bacterium]